MVHLSPSASGSKPRPPHLLDGARPRRTGPARKGDGDVPTGEQFFGRQQQSDVVSAPLLQLSGARRAEVRRRGERVSGIRIAAQPSSLLRAFRRGQSSLGSTTSPLG